MSTDFRFGKDQDLRAKHRKREQMSHARDRKTIPHVIINGVEKKSCSRCGSLKPLEEYRNRPSASDGKSSACKDCEKESK